MDNLNYDNYDCAVSFVDDVVEFGESQGLVVLVINGDKYYYTRSSRGDRFFVRVDGCAFEVFVEDGGLFIKDLVYGSVDDVVDCEVFVSS